MKPLILLILGSFLAATAAASTNVEISVVPEPNSIVYRSGSFRLTGATGIVCAENDTSIGKYLKQQLLFFTHLDLKMSAESAGKRNTIVLRTERAFVIHGPEAYRLEVSPETVRLISGTREGLFRGVQTLLQLIPLPGPGDSASFDVPSCRIVDHPRFTWRGLNLDCVRHFMTPDFIKRYIDLLAYYKFNVFHWHLTDDQGWRIQIKKYPRLTSVGAWRTEGNGQKYGGYYTQKEIREIVAYARSRFITVVPEIEMPGHCQASLAAYPENGSVPGPFQVGTQWGVYKNIYSPAKKSTYTFLENVLSEVIELFPSHYIHIGGDEVPKTEWMESASCRRLMKEKGMESAEELQSYFVRKIQKFLRSKGRQMIGWNEILEGGGPLPGAVVQSWQGIDGAIQAARKGDYTIVSPSEYTYLSRDAGDLSLDSVYSFDPMPPGLTPSEQRRVLGTEASMWSEHSPQQDVDGKMFPRLLAISEDAWTNLRRKDYADFHRRLQVQYNRLAYLGVDYGLEKKAITYKTRFVNKEKQFTISLRTTQAGITPRYTVGDTLTMSDSHKYAGPVTIDTTGTFIAQAEMKGRLVGEPLRLSFMIDKALNAKVTLKQPYSPRYTAGGTEGLVDGILGTHDFHDGLWQGYKGIDFEATVDLRRKKKISEIGAGFLQSTSSYIFMPKKVEFFVSNDGVYFRKVGAVKNNVSEKDPRTIRKNFAISLSPDQFRYFRVIAKNIGVCPPWHPGAGSKAWVFVDEIFAN